MEPAPATSTNDSARPDGRNQRKVRTRAAILAACRDMMLCGAFQPPIAEVARRAGVSVRSAFQLFGDVEKLRLAALTDPATFNAILTEVLGQRSLFGRLPVEAQDRVVRAAVLGRL